MVRTGLPIAGLSVLTLLQACTWVRHPSSVVDSPPTLAEVVAARDIDRGHVLDVKEMFKPADPQYQQARELYRKVYARYDGWIIELGRDVEEGNKVDPRTDKKYKDLAEAAGRADNDFAIYVESLTGRSKGVPSFAASIVDAGIKIWNAWRDAELKKRKEVANYITGQLKWETWEAIKPETNSPPKKSEAPPG